MKLCLAQLGLNCVSKMCHEVICSTYNTNILYSVQKQIKILRLFYWCVYSLISYQISETNYVN